MWYIMFRFSSLIHLYSNVQRVWHKYSLLIWKTVSIKWNSQSVFLIIIEIKTILMIQYYFLTWYFYFETHFYPHVCNYLFYYVKRKGPGCQTNSALTPGPLHCSQIDDIQVPLLPVQNEIVKSWNCKKLLKIRSMHFFQFLLSKNNRIESKIVMEEDNVLNQSCASFPLTYATFTSYSSP